VPPARPDLPDRLGWAIVVAVTLVVLASWAPQLGNAFGDNHEGRILARHALHIANAEEAGLAGSGWLSDFSPYRESYSHHPPLLNLGYYVTAQVLPVEPEVSLRLFAYLLGAAMLPIGVAIGRRLGVRWIPLIVATVLMSATPMFWVYGRLSGFVTVMLLMLLGVVRVAESRPIPATELTLVAVASFAAVASGHLGMAASALAGLWLLSRRGIDRVTVTVGIAMALGAAVTLAYVVGNTGASDVAEQVAFRTTGGGFTPGEFLDRLATWADNLFPVWWRWVVAPVGLAAGLLARRTRPLVVILSVVGAGYVFGLPNGSFIHDYWMFPFLLPVFFGSAAIVDAALERAPGGRREIVAGVAAIAMLAAAAAIPVGELRQRYLTAGEAAGELVRSVSPPTGQTGAMQVIGIAAPRWHSYYWDLPPLQLSLDGADRGGDIPVGAVTEVADGELVLIRTDRLPDWLPDAATVEAAAIAIDGRYSLVEGAVLRGLVMP
jgi:hypothetical protein